MARVPCVIVVKNNVVEENVLCRDGKHAEKVFLDKLAERLSNWDEYDQDDIDAVLDNGYEEFGNGSVCLSWAMSGDEDEEYLGMDKGEETKFVARVTVVDPDSHGEVEVEIRKIVEGGSMVGLDGSFLEQDVGCVYSPYDFGVRLRVPDDEEKSLSRAEQLLKDAIDGLVEFYPELTHRPACRDQGRGEGSGHGQRPVGLRERQGPSGKACHRVAGEIAERGSRRRGVPEGGDGRRVLRGLRTFGGRGGSAV